MYFFTFCYLNCIQIVVTRDTQYTPPVVLPIVFKPGSQSGKQYVQPRFVLSPVRPRAA